MQVYREVFSTMRLVNMFFTSLITTFFVVVAVGMVRTREPYSHSNSQVYNTILLTVVIMLYLRFLDFMRGPYNWKFVLF